MLLKRELLEQLARVYRSFVSRRDLPLLRLGDDAFAEIAEDHARLLQEWAAGLEKTLHGAETLFRARTLEGLSFEERLELRRSWASVLDYIVALDQIKLFHEHFPAVSPVRSLRRHAQAFALCFGAFVMQYVSGLRLVRMTEGGGPVAKLLDEEIVEHGVPPRSFHRLKWNVLHVVDVARLAAGGAYLQALRPVIRRMKRGPELVLLTEEALAEARVVLKERGVKYFVENALAVARSRLFDAWFPLQKALAQWCGRTRLRDRGRPLISAAQVKALGRRLQPGDILIERRNWNMSNVGLPGFWPHAALYVGRAEQLPEDLAAKLRAKYPSAWRRFHEAHEDGCARSVIEALAPGVIFNSLERSAAADYLGVIRPAVGWPEKGRAIERAFHYLGRPYDFDFDFTTDAALVCSELVWKCYQRSVPFELITVAGRPVLPPNEMVGQFGTGKLPLQFVAFLDGIEEDGRAVERGEQEFRASHRRPKWCFLQP